MKYNKSLLIGVSLLNLISSAYTCEWSENKENLNPKMQEGNLANFDEKNKYATLSLPFTLSTSMTPPQDSFSWQNTKHYQQLTELFKELSNRELHSIINRLIGLINANASFFIERDNDLIDYLKNTIFEWIMDDVLSCSNFIEDRISAASDKYSEMDMDEEDDDWRLAYMEGFNRENSDDESMDSSYFTDNEDEDEEDCYYGSEHEESAMNMDERDSFYDSELEENYYGSEDESDEDAFHEWQKQKLWEMLHIDVKDIKDFTLSSIDRPAIKQFLEEHCDGGYSWLINEIIEGSFETSDNFVDEISSQIDVPRELLSNIFGGLWFEYDWEEFNFDNADFIAKTYIQTLTDLLESERAEDVKSYLLDSLYQLFTFNGNDFDTPYNSITTRYNEYVAKNDWLRALIEWSVYTTYRKIFEKPAKKSKVNSYKTTIPALPVLSCFHKEKYLTSRIDAAFERAKESYTKVYPHLETKYIVYGKPNSPFQARLDLQKALGNLRQVGKHLEPHRKGKQTANVFVPTLFFIVSSKTDKKTSKHFLEVPLIFNDLPRRPLTCHTTDKVFETDYKGTDSYYFDQVRQDVVTGKVIQGHSPEAANKSIEELINNTGLCNPQLVHSERVLVEIFKHPHHIQTLCNNLVTRLRENFGAGLYKVHGGALLGYSTNTICPNCTPTLLSWQNSHEEQQFLNLFTHYMNNLTGDVQCYIKGYDTYTQTMNWDKFRLSTFITASINFDPQANDLADTGQHSHTKNKSAPKETHNPHAKLFFPQNEINLSHFPLRDDNTPEKLQRFFYEFIGKDIHESIEEENPYFDAGNLTFPGVIFSSGSETWGDNLMQ
jgi:hypothetical protein